MPLTSTGSTSTHGTQAASPGVGETEGKGAQAEEENAKNIHTFFIHLKRIYIKRTFYGVVGKQEALCFKVLIPTAPLFLLLGLIPTRPYLLLGPKDHLRDF